MREACFSLRGQHSTVKHIDLLLQMIKISSQIMGYLIWSEPLPFASPSDQGERDQPLTNLYLFFKVLN